MHTISSSAHVLIESMCCWLCPCLPGSLDLLTTVNVGTLCSDHRWFSLFVAVKTEEEEKQLITLFLSQAPADISGWFLCSSLASGDLQGCALLFTVYVCQNSGNLGSYTITSESFWSQTLEPSERLLGALGFQTPVPAQSSYLILLYKLCQGIGNYRLKHCLCSLLCIPRKFKKRILPPHPLASSTGSKIRHLPTMANFKWQFIFHFYCWHVEVSFQSLKKHHSQVT